MRPTPTHERGGLWHEVSNLLLGSLVLCLASLASGALGALMVLRFYLIVEYRAQAPTFGALLRILFWHAVGR
jgi:hypothetical protein